MDGLLTALIERTDGRAVDRRAFLRVAALCGAAPALFRLTPAPAAAAARELVVVNWGGDAVRAFETAWLEPFRKGNPALKVTLDGSGPSLGKIKAMVEARHVTWDVCDRNLLASLELGYQDLLEPVDWSVVDPNKLRPEHRTRWGVGSYLFSFVLAYDRTAFGGREPRSWADFWNLKDFPGRRMLRRNVEGQLEAALLADGVEPAKLYPLDVPRALEKIKEIKQHTIFWDSGASSQQILRDGEAVLGNLWNTRASTLAADTKGRIAYTFNQGLLQAGAWIVPKGSGAAAEAWRFIASTQDPASQVALFEIFGNGPINPAASALIPADRRAGNPGDPANIALQIPVDPEWYAHHYADALNRYTEVISA